MSSAQNETRLRRRVRCLPECKTGSVATVQEVVLLFGHHNLLALHGGYLGCVGGDSGWRRGNRGRPTGLAEPCPCVIHCTLDLIHWRLMIHLWWLWLRSGRNRILVHRRMYGLSRNGRNGRLLGGSGIRWRRGKMVRSVLHRGGLRCGRIHAPAGRIELLLVDNPRRIRWITGRCHARYHGVVRWR